MCCHRSTAAAFVDVSPKGPKEKDVGQLVRLTGNPGLWKADLEGDVESRSHNVAKKKKKKKKRERSRLKSSSA